MVRCDEATNMRRACAQAEKTTVSHARIPPPWKISLKLRAQRARIARLRKRGLLPHLTKTELRALAPRPTP